jgi:hypothetical protein
MDQMNKVDNVKLTASDEQTFPEGLVETSNIEEAESYTSKAGSDVKTIKQAILEGNIPGAYNKQYVGRK